MQSSILENEGAVIWSIAIFQILFFSAFLNAGEGPDTYRLATSLTIPKKISAEQLVPISDDEKEEFGITTTVYQFLSQFERHETLLNHHQPDRLKCFLHLNKALWNKLKKFDKTVVLKPKPPEIEDVSIQRMDAPTEDSDTVRWDFVRYVLKDNDLKVIECRREVAIGEIDQPHYPTLEEMNGTLGGKIVLQKGP